MRINIDETRIRGHLYFYGDQPFTGEAIETISNGTVIALTTIRDGIPHGPNVEWYPNGQVEYEATIRDGIVVGTSRLWHANGQLAEERDHDDYGHMIGCRRWDESGVPAVDQQAGT